MNGIEKITAKIAADAEAEVNSLRAETDAKIAALRAQTAAQAEQERRDILNRGEKAAAERLERLASAAQMEKRKLQLSAKQAVVGEAFDRALEQLCALPEQEYIDLLARMILAVSTTGREQVIFSVQDRARVGKAAVMAANEAMVNRVVPELPNSLAETKVGAFLGKVVNSTAAMVTGTGMLTLSEETRPIRGGFVLVDGDVETNCAFEVMVRLQRESMEKAVAQALFG